MVVDRDKLKAMAIARMKRDMLSSPQTTPEPPQPREPEAATPLPEPAPSPPTGRRRPGRRRVIPAQPAAPAPPHGSFIPDGFLPHTPNQKRFVRLTSANRQHEYRISCPRDYDPAAPIVFISVRDEATNNPEYIGLIRPPGNFMWGRKSQLSASDPRVIMFDEFYHSLQTTGSPPAHMVYETQ